MSSKRNVTMLTIEQGDSRAELILSEVDTDRLIACIRKARNAAGFVRFVIGERKRPQQQPKGEPYDT